MFRNTVCSIFIGGVSRIRLLGYLYGKSFGSKIAWANRKEGGLRQYRFSLTYILLVSIWGSLPSTAYFSTLTRPLPVAPPSEWLKLFSRQTFTCINTPTISFRLFLLLTLPMKMGQNVLKRWHIKFRCQGISQKKEYNKFVYITRKMPSHPLIISLFSKNALTSSATHSASHLTNTSSSFLGVKWPEHEADHSSPSSAIQYLCSRCTPPWQAQVQLHFTIKMFRHGTAECRHWALYN